MSAASAKCAGPDLMPTDRAGLLLCDTYRVLGRIGSGNMADVYEAEHVRLGRRAAVKVLRAQGSPQRHARFQREARTLARLDDEHVVAVLDCGELSEGTPYLIMERLIGEDLREYLRRAGSMPFDLVAQIGVDACRGLSAVHAAGLVHRDIKPANLFLTQRHGRCWCKILDFGIAKLTNSAVTEDGALLGTLRYMAPEQLVNSASVTPQTDVYAVGAVMYEAIAGRPPHTAEDASQLMFDILNREVPALESIAAVPRELARVVGRALAREPEARYPSARALEVALAPFCPAGRSASDVTASDETGIDHIPSSGRRRRSWNWGTPTLWATAALALAAGCASLFRGETPRDVRKSVVLSQTPRQQPAAEAGTREAASAAPPASALLIASGSPRARPPASAAPARSVARNKSPSRTTPSPIAGMFDGENPYR